MARFNTLLRHYLFSNIFKLKYLLFLFCTNRCRFGKNIYCVKIQYPSAIFIFIIIQNVAWQGSISSGNIFALVVTCWPRNIIKWRQVLNLRSMFCVLWQGSVSSGNIYFYKNTNCIMARFNISSSNILALEAVRIPMVKLVIGQSIILVQLLILQFFVITNSSIVSLRRNLLLLKLLLIMVKDQQNTPVTMQLYLIKVTLV